MLKGTLSVGMVGTEVTDLQRKLVARGFDLPAALTGPSRSWPPTGGCERSATPASG